MVEHPEFRSLVVSTKFPVFACQAHESCMGDFWRRSGCAWYVIRFTRTNRTVFMKYLPFTLAFKPKAVQAFRQ